MRFDEICDFLKKSGIENPAWDAALLIEHFCHIEAALVPVSGEDYTSKELLGALRKRAQHEPLQYLLGEWQFWQQTYEVSEDCLIPRSDTERLVELAIEKLPEGARFLDLCTGSGCIAVSTLASRRDTSAVALDKFENTLRIASRNAAKNAVSDRISFLRQDLLQESLSEDLGKFDAILSNPPYIPTSVISTLSDEVKREPFAALDGGEDGLIFYRRILGFSDFLKKDGFFLFEIGYDQGDALLQLGEQFGFSDRKVYRDYGGNDRVVYLSRLRA